MGGGKKLTLAMYISVLDYECVALEAGKLRGDFVSMEAQCLNEIITKNFDKVKNKKSGQQFQTS